MRRVIVTLLICVFALGMNAQDMTSVFTAMPDQYIPQLEHAWRKDLVDLYTSGKESRLKNTMNGFSTLQKLTNDYLLLQTTERSTVEMKLLPLVNNTYVVCMISTVIRGGPPAEIPEEGLFKQTAREDRDEICRGDRFLYHRAEPFPELQPDPGQLLQ